MNRSHIHKQFLVYGGTLNQFFNSSFDAVHFNVVKNLLDPVCGIVGQIFFPSTRRSWRRIQTLRL
jgi:hypothetical protein